MLTEVCEKRPDSESDRKSSDGEAEDHADASNWY